MKKLYLLRHASAADTGPGTTGDHGRPLSARGQDEADRAGKFLQAAGIAPAFALCSSSARTLETVQAVFRLLPAAEIHVARGLYLAPAEAILQHIHAVDDGFSSLLVCAHNPGVTALSLLLGARTEDFSPATLAAYHVDAPEWGGLSAQNTRLEKVFAPE